MTKKNKINQIQDVYFNYIPLDVHGIRQREHCAISNALDGYGSRIDPRTPTIAGTPLSSANWT